MVETLVKDTVVTTIDNSSTGKLENIRHLANAGPWVIEGNVAALDLATFFRGVITFFTWAALPSVPRSIKDAPLSNRIPIPRKNFPKSMPADLVSGVELVLSETAAFSHFGALFPRSFPENLKL